MLWLSLFKRFGKGGKFQGEAEKIAALIQDKAGISNAEFFEIIEKMRKMKVLQGASTLYITPKILHVYLWVQWWERYGEGMMGSVVSSISEDGRTPQLFRWYCEMFEYAKQSPQASEIVTKLLRPGGFFDGNEALKTQLGADFFLTLSRVDRRSALACLERAIGRQSRADLKTVMIGRRQVVWALEGMARHEDTFERASWLLLRLAEAENETYANNATGTFCSLFVPGAGRFAKTRVAPRDRVPILREAISSGTEGIRDVAIMACGTALQRTHISIVTTNMSPFERDPGMWTPESDGDVIEYYREILRLLAEAPEGSDPGRAARIILDSLRDLAPVPGLGECALDVADRLHAEGRIDAEELLKRTILIMDHDKDDLEPRVLKKLEGLQDRAVGTGFHSMMRRYVGMDIMLDWRGKPGGQEPRKGEVADLAGRASDPAVLGPELDWLVTDRAKHGYAFGYELARNDPEYRLLPMIMDALRKAGREASGFFVSGYLRRVFDTDPGKWKEHLDRVYDDPGLVGIFPEIVYRSGLTDEVGEMIRRGIEDGKFGHAVMGTFMYGGAINALSEMELLRWTDLLLGRGIAGTIIALNLFGAYFAAGRQRALPKEAALRILLHDAITSEQDPSSYDVLSGHYWGSIGLEFVKQHPGDAAKITEAVIGGMGTENFFDHCKLETFEVLDEIARTSPKRSWAAISKHIGPPLDDRADRIMDWLRGGITSERRSPFKAMLDEIIAWTDEDGAGRAPYIARFMPSEFEVAREFLARYPDREGVGRQIAINFDSEGWSGPDTAHFEKKKRKFEEYRAAENDKNVALWLDRYILGIERDIRRAADADERELLAS